MHNNFRWFSLLPLFLFIDTASMIEGENWNLLPEELFPTETSPFMTLEHKFFNPEVQDVNTILLLKSEHQNLTPTPDTGDYEMYGPKDKPKDHSVDLTPLEKEKPKNSAVPPRLLGADKLTLRPGQKYSKTFSWDFFKKPLLSQSEEKPLAPEIEETKPVEEIPITPEPKVEPVAPKLSELVPEPKKTPVSPKQIALPKEDHSFTLNGSVVTSHGMRTGTSNHGEGAHAANMGDNLSNATGQLHFSHSVGSCASRIGIGFGHTQDALSSESTLSLHSLVVDFQIINTPTTKLDILAGRVPLNEYFESKVQFGAPLHGLLMRYQLSSPEGPNFNLRAAPMVTHTTTNHLGIIAEAHIDDISQSGFFGKFSYIDWGRKTHSNAQILLGYHPKDGIANIPVTLTGALVVNCSSQAKEHSNAWYIHLDGGYLKKAGDWAFELEYQSVGLNAVADHDASGLKAGHKGWKLQVSRLTTDTMGFKYQFSSSSPHFSVTKTTPSHENQLSAFYKF